MIAIYNIGVLTIALLVAYIMAWTIRKAWNDYKQEISNQERVKQNRKSMRQKIR